MDGHGLEADSAWAGEAVPDELAAAGEDASGEALELRFHSNALVFVDPAAGFDVDLLTGSEGNFKHVAVAMQPQDAVAAMGDESIDEEAGAPMSMLAAPLTRVKV